ncbi:hypothetical protein Dimus_003261 [Dionaea muscipula]
MLGLGISPWSSDFVAAALGFHRGVCRCAGHGVRHWICSLWSSPLDFVLLCSPWSSPLDSVAVVLIMEFAVNFTVLGERSNLGEREGEGDENSEREFQEKRVISDYKQRRSPDPSGALGSEKT